MGILNAASYNFNPYNFYAWSSVLNAVAAYAIGALVLSRKPSDKRYRSFFVFAMTIFAWAVPYTFLQLAVVEDVALFWGRALFISANFVTVSLLYFTLNFLGIKSYYHRLAAALFLLAFVFFSAANLTPLFVSHVEPMLNFPFWQRPGPLFHSFLFLWLLCFTYAAVLLTRGYINAVGEVRQQLKLISDGLIFGVLAGSTNYLMMYEVPIPPIFNGLTSIYVLLIGYAMLRYRLFEIGPMDAAQTIVDGMTDPLFMVNTEQRISVANPAAADAIGLKAESLLGENISKYLPCAQDIIARMAGSENKILSGVSGDDINIRAATGHLILISLSVSLIPVQKKHGFVFICRNISDPQK
ncbi:MAG: histidine kinase N-terminal 7TM domain-containing protein [Patescibacteria group bacterium]